MKLDFSKINKYFLLVVCLLSSASLLAQEKGQQLYEENLEASKFISSFQMDCRQATPRCRERSSALRAEETFNQYMEVIFERVKLKIQIQYLLPSTSKNLLSVGIFLQTILYIQ